jgi:hypothetical protein
MPMFVSKEKDASATALQRGQTATATLAAGPRGLGAGALGERINIMNAIRKARTDGLFLVLTADGAKGFATPNQCDEYGASLAGREFSVVRFLWDGGEEEKHNQVVTVTIRP